MFLCLPWSPNFKHTSSRCSTNTTISLQLLTINLNTQHTILHLQYIMAIASMRERQHRHTNSLDNQICLCSIRTCPFNNPPHGPGSE